LSSTRALFFAADRALERVLANTTTSMSGNNSSWGDDWRVGLRVWVGRGSHPILGPGRLELLEALDRWHSIRQAARQLGMSYRRAWLLVQSINEAAGRALVTTATGGTRGGGAVLTPLGRRAMHVYRALQEQLERNAVALLPSLVQAPEAPALQVAAAVSLEEVLGQLLADYALRRPTVRVRAVYGGSDALAEQVLAGTPADLLLAADPRQLDRVAAAGLVVPGSRALLAENGLAAIARAEHAPRVRRPADLAAATVGRVAVAGPGSPLGDYTRAYLDAQGVWEALASRRVQLDNAHAVAAAVRAGQADVGLVYASDAALSGCRLLFRAGRGAPAIRYAGAVLRGGRRHDEAQLLLDFLGSPRAAGRFRRLGFRAVRAPRG
jgi:molybdate transport system substrate-binding protein